MSKPNSEADVARVARNIVMLDAAARVVQRLAEAGVDALVLKGAALVEMVSDIRTRHMADVDLLVRRSQARDAHRIMVAAGYEWWQPEGRPLATRWHYERAYVAKNRGVCELHTHLAHRLRWSIDHAGLFDRAVSFRLSGRDARRLSNEDMLLHLAINSAKDDCVDAARTSVDVAALLAGLSIQWSSVVARADAWNARGAMWTALTHAVCTQQAAVPPDVLAALAPDRVRARLLAQWFSWSEPDPYRGPTRLPLQRKLLVSALTTDRLWRYCATAGQLTALRALDAAARLIG